MEEKELIMLANKVKNVWDSNGPPSHMTLPFEHMTPVLSSIQMVTVQQLGLFLDHLLNGQDKFGR